MLRTLAESMVKDKLHLDRALGYARRVADQTTAFRPARRPPWIEESWWQKNYDEKAQQKTYPRRRSAALNTLGWVYYHVENYGEAERSLRQSVELNEGAENYFRLGLTLDKLGKSEEAARMLAMAVAYGKPAAENAKTALDELGSRNPSLDVKALLDEAAASRRRKVLAEIKASFVEEPAKDFELANLAGERYQLSALRGKVVLLNFWATW